MWILKPADLDLHCFLKRIYPGSAHGSQPQNAESGQFISLCLKTIDALNLKVLSFYMHTACFKF